MATRAIDLHGNALLREYLADAAITPGFLCERTATGVKKHANAGHNAQVMFALVDNEIGNDLDDDWAAASQAKVGYFASGMKVRAYLTTSQTITAGMPMESAGGGYVREHSAGSAGVVEYPDAIVGYAEEAVTTTSAAARITISAR